MLLDPLPPPKRGHAARIISAAIAALVVAATAGFGWTLGAAFAQLVLR